MSATFYRLADTNFCTSHQSSLFGSGLPSVPGSNYRTPNGGFLSAQAQPFVFFSCAVLLQFAPRGLNPSCVITGHRLTSRSSGTGQKLRFCPAPELLR
jgi:hypothetical protein